MTDFTLSEDLVEIHREAQKRVDRVKAARVELANAIDDLNAGREAIFAASATAVAYVDAYMNPLAPEPEPIAPEVALELPPESEIPVFTTVDAEEVTPENTSGGTVDIAPEVFVEEFGEYVEPAPVEEVTVEEAVAAIEADVVFVEQ